MTNYHGVSLYIVHYYVYFLSHIPIDEQIMCVYDADYTQKNPPHMEIPL